MQNVHPIFQQALRGIAPPADAKHWQAMCIQLRTELTQYDAPRCPRGQFEHVYQHPELGSLDCHLEGEDGDESVGWPEQVTLCDAYLRGVPITFRLTSDEVEAIEISALKQPNQELQHAY
jgi:hypothetical protein